MLLSTSDALLQICELMYINMASAVDGVDESIVSKPHEIFYWAEVSVSNLQPI